MGKTIAAAAAPISAAVGKGIQGVEAVFSGDIAKGSAEVVGGGVDFVKSVYGVTADNKFIGADVAKGSFQEFKANPVGSVMSVAQAYTTGGASLIPAAVAAGQSQLTSILNKSPSQLQSGGGAAPMVGENSPSAPMLPAPNYNVLAMGVFGALILVLYLKRR